MNFEKKKQTKWIEMYQSQPIDETFSTHWSGVNFCFLRSLMIDGTIVWAEFHVIELRGNKYQHLLELQQVFCCELPAITLAVFKNWPSRGSCYGPPLIALWLVVQQGSHLLQIISKAMVSPYVSGNSSIF